MASNVRVPKTEITGIYGGLLKRMSRRMLGEVPEGAEVMWHYPAVLKDMMGFGRKVEKWDQLDPNLASFAHMAGAALVGCSFCLDFNYFMALNRLRTLARRREEYVGEWPPEPLLTGPDLVAEDVELAESVSIAMLTVLETLGPAERAVFVLREVFEAPHEEIAGAIGKTPAAVRQIAHRSRRHVAAQRPRMEVSRAEQQRVVERFLAALNTGDVQGLMDALAPDVVLVSDGGGVVPAARRPIEGADRLAKFLVAGYERAPGGLAGAPVWLNGAPAARIDIDGEVVAAVAFVVENGRITRIYVISNPHKLARLDAEAALAR